MPTLYDPITIGCIELKNRLVMAPMAIELASERGEVTERLTRHYLDRCKGLGLVIVEAANVGGRGRMFERQLNLVDDSNVETLANLVEEIHRQDVKVAIQLAHAGGTASSKLLGSPPLAPSPIMIPDGGDEVPLEITLEQIDEVVVDFVDAAARAWEAGFDAVELHGAHGYLLNQFLSPLTNFRDDEYGGSIGNRMRISQRIIEGIKKISPGLALLYRLGAVDVVSGGLPLSQGVEAAVLLEEAGVDSIDVSGGIGVTLKWADEQSEVGFMMPQARAVKAAVKVPVIGVGGITSLEEADAMIRGGSADLVAVGRAILKNPRWATQSLMRN